jgi:hypothetical protein
MPQLRSAIVVAMSASGAMALILMHHHHQHQRRAKDKRKASRKKPSEPPAFHRGMNEKEYIPLIPRAELQAIKSFLATATKARGWPLSSSQPHESSRMMEAAWKRAEEEARDQGGGSWVDMFTPHDLQPAPLLLLAKTIDRVFLGGQMNEGGPLCHLRIVVEGGESGTTSDWISHFDENNVVHLMRPKWIQEVSEEQPMICEGVICTNRLQLLLRTVAHEMVHALVFNCWREIDRASPAYLPDERHGPIFKLLNLRLFGHTSDSYRYVFR